MLVDQNRTGTFVPDGFGAARNVVGSGSDGATYWNLFNFEGESTADSVYVTYGALLDMLLDQNRTGSFVPDGFGAARNVVGSGATIVPLPAGALLLASAMALFGTLASASGRARAYRCRGSGRGLLADGRAGRRCDAGGSAAQGGRDGGRD
jgi:hypothetical protein